MMHQRPLGAGVADPVHDAQAAFREALGALSRPGRRVTLGAPVPDCPLSAAMAHLLLMLTDDDTAVWWQQSDAATAEWLRFHTGATLADTPDAAAFAVVTNPGAMPTLDAFAWGSAESPEMSATLLVEVQSFGGGLATEWRGPGIQGMQQVRIDGLPADFWLQWQTIHAAFPQGIDVIFTCANEAMGLPRTAGVGRAQDSLRESAPCM